MTFDQFNSSLEQHTPPEMSVYLRALWYDGKGNWDYSHELIQDVQDRTASWIHAYLHRKEGDAFNARYWYNKAGQPVPEQTLQQEWEAIVKALL